MAVSSPNFPALSSVLLLVLTTIVTLIPGSAATICLGGEVLGVGCWICGKAENKTPWQMLYTTDPGGKCKDSCCQVLNWEDGEGSWSDAWKSKPASKLVACTQDPLAAGKSKGGNTCTKKNRVDVDAVTFADRDFVIATPQPAGKGGSTMHEKPITKGVWIKISSDETITCTERNGKPYCT